MDKQLTFEQISPVKQHVLALMNEHANDGNNNGEGVDKERQYTWNDFPEEEIPPQPELPGWSGEPSLWDDFPYDDIPLEPPRTPEGDKIGLAALEEMQNMFPPIDPKLARYIAESPELAQENLFLMDWIEEIENSYVDF
ncbi:MAG: hypothetical protein AAF639_42340 [Chloroflexota bacterium]